MAKLNINSKSKINLFKTTTFDNKEVLNIFSKYKLFEKYKKDISYYSEYEIQENDRWDTLAYKFYKDVNLWWIVAIFNNVIDPFQKLQYGETLNIIKPEQIPNILLLIRRAS